MVTSTLSPCARDADGDRLAGGTGLDGVLQQMADRLLEPDRIDDGAQRSVAEQPYVMVAALGGNGRRQDRPQHRRLAAPHQLRCLGRQARQQFVHLADRAFQRGDHVGAEFLIVGVTLGIARDERQLADEILDVVQDEGEAAVEFLEALGVRQRFLAMRFGQRACRLAPGGAEQVEILPVERAAIFGCGEQDQAEQRVVVDQRHAGPRFAIVGDPGGNGSDDPLLRWPPRRRTASSSMIRPDALQRGPELARGLELAGGRSAARPIPRRRRGDRAGRVLDQQQPAGRVEDVGEGLDDPLAKRRRVERRCGQACR